MVVVADVRLGGDVLLGPTLRSVPDATLETQYQATAETYTFAAEDCDFEALEAALEADPTVTRPRVIATLGERRVYRVQRAIDREILSEAAADLDVQILSATGTGGEWTIRMRAPDRRSLAALKRFCDEQDVRFRIERVFTEEWSGPGSSLTPAQRELLVAAHREGYFDEPRRVTLGELAATLGISSSAASGRLRRAMRALVGETVTGTSGATGDDSGE